MDGLHRKTGVGGFVAALMPRYQNEQYGYIAFHKWAQLLHSKGSELGCLTALRAVFTI
jgi:hypothetical protein